MAEHNINFVSQRRKRFSKTQQRDRIFLRVSAIVFGVVTALTLTVIGVRVFLGQRVERVEAQVDQVNQSLTLNQQTEQAYLVLLSKLNTLSTILTQRQDKQDALDYFTSLFGDEVILTEISYNDQTQILSLRVEAGTVFIFEEVITTLSSGQTAERYPTIGKSELSRDDTGIYQMNLAIQLGSGEEEVANQDNDPTQDPSLGAQGGV